MASNSDTPISISEVAAALRSATTEQRLVLGYGTLGEQVPADYLLQLLRVDALELSGAVLSEEASQVTVLGTTTLLELPNLAATLRIAITAGGVQVSLLATLAGGRTFELAGPLPLSIGGVSLALDARIEQGQHLVDGWLRGTFMLGGHAAQLSLKLPKNAHGWIVRGTFAETDRPGLSSLGQLVSGLDVESSVPAALTATLQLRDFELVLQKQPYVGCTIVAPPFAILPNTLSISDIELFVGATLPTPTAPMHVDLELRALLDAGSLLIPIVLQKLDSGAGWRIAMDTDFVPLPGIADLAPLFGDAQALDTVFPGLSGFGGIGLSDLQVDFTLAPAAISALSFRGRTAAPWTLPMLSDLPLQEASAAISITDPLRSTRAVTGSVSGRIVVAGHEFSIGGDKDTPSAPWKLTGRQLEEDPLSLTALFSEALGGALPDGMPDLAFVNLEVSATPATGEFTLSGSTAAPWVIPLGITELSLADVDLAFHRALVEGRRKATLRVRGKLAIGSVTATLAMTLPGGFALSADLPQIKLADVLSTLGGGAVLEGLGLPSSFFNLTLGPSTLTLDAAAKTASLRGSATGFSAFELQLRRDSRGKTGAALALQPAAGVNLQTLLGVPGLDGLDFTDLVFVLSSLHDPSLRFAAPAFSAVGPISRGFGFSTKLRIAALGVDAIPGLPTAPITVQARFGRSLSDFTLAAALSEPGGSFLLDQKSGLRLIDPELRISPATSEIAVAGKLKVVLDSQPLEFSGGFKLANGSAALFATMQGDWVRPFGLSGVVARDLALQLTLPGLPALSGTLQIGRTTGALTIKPDPPAPVFDVRLDSLDLHELITSVCDPALADVPAAYRQTIADVRIADAQIYLAPRDATIDQIFYPAGVRVAGTLHAWGFTVAAQVRTVGSEPLKSLAAEGLVSLPDLGGLLVLKGGRDANNVERSGPYFKLDLKPGQPPVVILAAAIEIFGSTGPSIDIELNDAGFRAAFSNQLFGGNIRARLEVSGGRLGPNTKYAVAAELDPSSIGDLLNGVSAKVKSGVEEASREIARASALRTGIEQKGVALAQDVEDKRRVIQAERDHDAATLRQAEIDVQSQSAKVDALLRELSSARATVQDERAEVDRRIGAAQRDVNAARAAVNSLNDEINRTDRWFYGLPKIDVPWEPSQAREGTWFALKMAGLYTARDTANAALDVAGRALQAVIDTQHSFPVDLDPRVAGIVAAHASAQATLDATQHTIVTLRRGLTLFPIDADFRLVALRSMQEAQNVQLVAAKAALALAQNTLDGVKALGDAFAPSITIRRAYFAGELSLLAGGKVRLGLEISTSQGARSFTIAFDLKDPLSAVAELANRLLGTDIDAAVATAKQSTETAQNTAVEIEREALPTDAIVNIRCQSTGKFVRVLGDNLLRFGDTVSLRASSGHYLCAENTGQANANRGAIGGWEQWVIVNPNDLGSRDFVRYGNSISLRSYHNTYLVAEDTGAVNANRAAIGAWEKWILFCAPNPNRAGEVDTSLAIALWSHHGHYMGATNGGGSGTYATVNAIGAYESFGLVAPDHSAQHGSLLADSDLPLAYESQFRLKRSGEWIGFQSIKNGLFVSMRADLTVRAVTSNFAAAGDTWEHFRAEGPALYNQGQVRYLRFPGGAAGTSLLDGQETMRSAVSAGFEILQRPPLPVSTMVFLTTGSGTAVQGQPPTVNATAVDRTASDQATSTGKKGALAGEATTANAGSAERSATQQATDLRAGAASTVEPVRQALALAELARRARRQRAIEKAARGPREALSEFRDSALRFDGRSYLEAPASRVGLREQPSTEVAPQDLPVDTLVTIRCTADGQLVRVLGKNPLRYGDTISLRVQSGRHLWAEQNGAAHGNAFGIGNITSFVIVNSIDPSSTDFVRYGDAIALRSFYSQYLVSDEDRSIKANRATVGAWSRWTLVLASDPSLRDEVDISQRIALRSAHGQYLSASSDGGPALTSVASIGDWQSFGIVGPDRTAFDNSLVVRGHDPLDPACQFRLKRNENWIGFQSVKTGLHIQTRSDLSVRAWSGNFTDPGHTWEHYQVAGAALYNQGQSRFLRRMPSAAGGPQLVDGAGDSSSAADSGFVIQKAIDDTLQTRAARVEARPMIELGIQFTIDAWICPEAFGTTQSILCKWVNGDDDEVHLYLTPEGRLALSWNVAGSGGWGTPGKTFCQSDEPVKLDAWNHVAAVREGDAVTLYIDGRSVGGAQGLGSAGLRVGAASWRIGAQVAGGDNHFFIGLIDSIRLWSRAFSAAALRARRYLVSRGDESGLLACWNFDEETGDTAFDATRRELHAKLVGRVLRASPGAPEGPPLPDRHLILDSGAHVAIGEVDLFGNSAQMTFEAWLRLDRISDSIVTIVGKWAQGENDSFLFGLSGAGHLILGWHSQGGITYGTASWNHVQSSGTIPLGRWCHVAAARDGRTIRFYRDGQPIGESDSADDQPLRRGTAPVFIGSEGGSARFLTGSIRELRVFQRAVSAPDLRDHHQRPFVGDEPGLVGLWRFDEGAGSIVRDATIRRHHGTLVGPVRWSSRGGPPLRVGPTRGLRFSGGQYVELGDADQYSPTVALTIEAWINVDTIASDFTSIVNKWMQSADSEYLFGLMPDGRLAFAWHTTGSNTYGSASFWHVFSAGTVSLGRWTHVAVVRAGRSVRFYIDGQIAGAADVADLEPFVNSNATLRIGAEAHSAGRFLQGTLAGLRIWRSARTQEQLAEAMSGLVSSRAPGRIVDLRFDEGEGWTVLDAATWRLGQGVGPTPPAFVPVTLPVRVPVVTLDDPSDVWLQPALDAARRCKDIGVDAAAALIEIETALQQLERATHGSVLALLAKAGYSAAALGEAAVRVWGHTAAEVARQFCDTDRPVTEAMAAVDAALRQTAEGSTHSTVVALLGAAGYLPEELGPALLDGWGPDARAVAQLCRDAGLTAVEAVRAAWAALGRGSVQTFAALVDSLLAGGHAGSAVRQGMQAYFGCDASSIERAALRARISLTALPQQDFYLIDAKHRLCVVAGDVYDGNVYHQAPTGRANARFRLEPAPGGGFYIRDQKHGKCLVAGDTYDGHVYHQDPNGRANARWDLVQSVDALGFETVWLLDQKHGKALVTGDIADGAIYHQDPQLRENARFVLFPIPGPAALRDVQTEQSIHAPVYNFSTRSASEAMAAGWTQQFVGFVAFDQPYPGTIPVARETPVSSPGSQFHLASRTAEEANQLGWMRTDVAFYAFPWQVPGTVPVYREQAPNGTFYFSVRSKDIAQRAGFSQRDVAFYAYPPDARTAP